MTADVKGINEKLVNELIKRKLKISTAESCTGGLLAALITAVKYLRNQLLPIQTMRKCVNSE